MTVDEEQVEDQTSIEDMEDASGTKKEDLSSTEKVVATKTLAGEDSQTSGDGHRVISCSSHQKRNILAVAAILVVLFAIIFPIAYILAPPNSRQREYVLMEGPFYPNLTLFNENITQGYTSKEDLERDVEAAAYFLVNQAIKRELGVPGYGHYYMENDGGGWREGMPPMMANSGAPESMAKDDTDGGSAAADEDSLTDYGTNNQEDDVEEGDVVVSDGEHGKSSCPERSSSLIDPDVPHTQLSRRRLSQFLQPMESTLLCGMQEMVPSLHSCASRLSRKSLVNRTRCRMPTLTLGTITTGDHRFNL